MPLSPPRPPEVGAASSCSRSPFRWWVLFLLFSGTFINAIDRGSLSTAAPYLMKELGLDTRLMGIALSAFFWFYLLMNIPAGHLADRYGARRTLSWAASLWSVCSALTGLATHFVHVLLARIGVGMGEAASFPVNVRIVSNSFEPAERGMATGCYSCGLRVGFAVTPLLMAWLISHWSWRLAFYVTGLGSLLWVAVWRLTYREESPTQAGTPHPLPPARGHSLPWLPLLAHRTVLGLVLCKFFQDYLFYLFVTWLPGYLVMERGFTLMKMGWYASLPWVAGAIAQPLVGWGSDLMIRQGVSITISRKSLIVLTQLLAGAAVVVAGYSSDALLAVWVLTVAVACESASTSILWATCTDVAPPAVAGSLAGIMNTAGALAGSLAPAVTGFLVKSTGGFQLPLLLGSGMVVLAALAMAFVVGELRPLDVDIYPFKPGRATCQS